MNSVVLDLQKEVLDPDCDILNALRKAHLIASKLNLQEFDTWIMHELNGYSVEEQDEIPEYRKIKGKLKAYRPYHGWMPVFFQDSKMKSLLCTKYLGDSIGRILELYKNPEGQILLSYPEDIEREIDKMCSSSFPTKYALHVSRHILKSIIDQVQNCLLEWTMKLEDEGILGEGMRFSQEETAIAKNVQQTINYYGTVVNGDIMQSQVVSGSNNTITYDFNAVADAVTDIKESFKTESIAKDNIDSALEILQDISDKLEQKKKPHIIKSALIGLKEFAIDVGASVTAKLIAEKMQGLF